MSLQWRDRLIAYLAPDAVAWLRVGGFPFSRVLEKRHEPAAGTGASSWAGSLERLQASIAALGNRRLSVTIVLSNHFVRYAVLPNVQDIRDAGEAHALAEHHFSGIYGECVARWTLRVARVRGKPCLASAIDTALLEQLRSQFPGDGRLRLESVQPLLIPVFNQYQASMPAAGAWLLMAEKGRACAAFCVDGGITAVASTRGDFASLAQYDAFIARERLRNPIGDESQSVRVYNCGGLPLAGVPATSAPVDARLRALGLGAQDHAYFAVAAAA